MKKLLLLLIVALFPLSTFASEGNTNFWGWTWYMANTGEKNIVFSWKLYNTYTCTLLERYDNFSPIEKEFPRKGRDFDYVLTANRVYCKVRDYQCSCIYK